MNWSRFAHIRTAVLTIAGLACLIIAAALVHAVAGFAAAGLAFLLLEFLTQPPAGGDAP